MKFKIILLLKLNKKNLLTNLTNLIRKLDGKITREKFKNNKIMNKNKMKMKIKKRKKKNKMKRNQWVYFWMNIFKNKKIRKIKIKMKIIKEKYIPMNH